VGRFTGIVVLALLAFACTANASDTQESIFQDDDRLLHATPAESDATLQELKDLGVDRIRLSVIWRNFAPSRDAARRPRFDGADPAQYPAEEFDPLDHVMRVARRMGIEVLLNVRGDVPDWAMPRRPKKFAGRRAYLPSTAGFHEFVAMMGRRYDGTYEDENQGRNKLPRASAWSIWNEPNWSGLLQPQTIRDRHRRLKAISPLHYRKLYRSAVRALRDTGHGGDVILMGETAPVGNDKEGELSHIRPVQFLRSLFCLDSRNRPLSKRRAVRAGCDFDRRGPLHASGYAHHPYSVVAPPGQPSANPGFITLADSDRLKAILDAAAAAGRIPPGLPVWYTEFGYQTAPPDPFRGISLEQHAQWLVDAEMITSSDPRIAAHTQFLLRDDEPRTIYPERDPRRWVTYQTGIQFDDGRPKPAYAAYRLPLRATPQPDGTVQLWGMVRPGGAQERIRIEYRGQDESEWRSLGERTVTQPRGYWSETIPSLGPGFYRFEWLRSGPGALGLPGQQPVVRAASPEVPVG
jgi:hypothetical protein